MEPVTHILTGACLARTGLNRRAAYTTLAMAVAAEFPDIDTLWSLRGPLSGFEHHRGITHTFLGIPFEAALIVAAIYALHRWRTHKAGAPDLRFMEIGEYHSPTTKPGAPSIRGTWRMGGVAKSQPTQNKPLTAAPPRWGLLYVFTLLALLSHLFLDYTNNYGLRPFFPFNSHWYAASIVFIFDPLIFALLLAALVLPPIFRLVGSEVGARRQPFAARGWAIAALLGVAALWTLRETQHNRALQIALAQSIEAPIIPGIRGTGDTSAQLGADQPPPDPNKSSSSNPAAPDPGLAPDSPPPVYLQAQRALASPDPFNPFRWSAVTDFGSLYQLGQVDTRNASIAPAQDTHPKLSQLESIPAVRTAEASHLGRVYLDWSPMPFVTVNQPSDPASADGDGDRSAAGLTVVTFRDPRFMGDIPFLSTSGRTPLTGTVELDPHNHIVRQTMDGKPQHP